MVWSDAQSRDLRDCEVEAGLTEANLEDVALQQRLERDVDLEHLRQTKDGQVGRASFELRVCAHCTPIASARAFEFFFFPSFLSVLPEWASRLPSSPAFVRSGESACEERMSGASGAPRETEKRTRMAVMKTRTIIAITPMACMRTRPRKST